MEKQETFNFVEEESKYTNDLEESETDLELENPKFENEESEEIVEDSIDEESEENPKDLESTEDDEFIISFDGIEPEVKEDEKPAPAWVKDLRKAHKQAQKENRELKKKLESLEQNEPKEIELKPKPILSDFDYDEKQYEKALEAWFADSVKRKEILDKREQEKKQTEQEWIEKIENYERKKAELKLKDFNEAESDFLENFNQTQQGIIVEGAENPALIVYALGKNPDKLQKLSEIKSPVKFAFEIAKIEKDLKLIKKGKKSPEPEKRISGSARNSGAIDSTLERLRKEAEKTGNYSKVTAYKKSKRGR